MDSEYALGRMVKKGAPVNRGLCSHTVRAHSRSALWSCLDKTSLRQTVQEWQMANTVFLGAPMHMQCKETHKCNQNRISRVRVKLSKNPQQSRHLNILFWGNLGNPDLLPKATCPSSPKLPRLGNLGTIGEG